jgi:hypothetical protein
MDETEEQRRWETTQELYRAADAAFQQQHYRACVGLAYYACVQAMWAALGDPPLGQWQQGGITRRFCHGQWTTPPIDPASLSGLYRRLLALYELRRDAHYRAQAVPSQQARNALDTAMDAIQRVQQHRQKQ